MLKVRTFLSQGLASTLRRRQLKRRPRARSPDESLIHNDADIAAVDVDEGKLSLEDLPYDVLLVVFTALSVRDLLSVARTSRYLNEVSTAHSIWESLALQILRDSKDLILEEDKPLSEISAPVLRKGVLRSFSLEANLKKPKPTMVSSYISNPLGCSLGAERGSRIISMTELRRQMILETANETLLCWNFDRNCSSGEYKLDCETGRMRIWGTASSEHRCTYAVIGEVAKKVSQDGYLCHLLETRYPDEGSTAPAQFNILANFRLPPSGVGRVRILDPVKRMLCVAFAQKRHEPVQLFVMFDWETGLSASVLTETTFDEPLDLRLSEDRESVIIVHGAGRPHIWKQRVYSLAELRLKASTDLPFLNTPIVRVEPAKVVDYTWGDEDESSETDGIERLASDVSVLHIWPGFKGARYKTSNFFTERFSETQYRICHYYATEDGPCIASPKTYTLHDPVLHIGGNPMTAWSFNLFCYVKQETVLMKGGETTRRRAVTLVNVLQAEEGNGESDWANHSKELDVPEDVLADVCGLDFFYSTRSSALLVTTSTNVMHIYRYA